MNPGSVGLSYDHVQPDDHLRVDAFAAYARIETSDGRVEIAFRRVPFDSDAVISAIRASGIPHPESLVTQWQPRPGQ